jgi:hypothetical protein
MRNPAMDAVQRLNGSGGFTYPVVFPSSWPKPIKAKQGYKKIS